MSLSMKMLGDFSVSVDDEPMNLPPSKRTRALLAYLAMTARPHRRERLCEMFWELPDDPRGALRWSLSKIRLLVNDEAKERLVADRERVTLLTTDIRTDIKSIPLRLEESGLSTHELKRMHKQLKEVFLDGIDLPNQDIFQQWLTSERLEVENLRRRVLSLIASHKHLKADEKLPFVQEWEKLEPYNPGMATQLLTLLELTGRNKEFGLTKARLVERFQNADIQWSPDERPQSCPAPQVPSAKKAEEKSASRDLLSRQKIQFCTAKDGARIAYASIGSGPPIVKAANWLSHLEHDWDSPIWSPLFRELALDHHFVRYDERGNGLSDWDVDDISFESFVTDLETVVEASQVDQFTLLGISQGAAVSIEYAIRHPERVTRLIIFGGYASGWRINATDDVIKEREAIITLTERGWGQNNPAYRQIFTSTFMPAATHGELVWFNEFQRLTTSPENAARFLSVFGDIDVRDQLHKITVPTLVIHSLDDQRIPVSAGRDIAATIPSAQFVGLESDNHLLLGREQASDIFIESVREFMQSGTRY